MTNPAAVARLLPAALALAGGAAWAQTPPGAGGPGAGGIIGIPGANPDRINEAARRRGEAAAQAPSAAPAAPVIDAPPPPPAAADRGESLRFTLTAVRFDASAYLRQEELDALARPLIGREVTFADLDALVARVNALYAARGLSTARAALPAQSIEGGVVTIRLIEGRIDRVSVTGALGRAAGHLRARAAPPAGTLAAPAALGERLRWFNLNNDTQVRAQLAPGSAFGRTDLTLIATQPARLSADLFADNAGFSSTGEAEAGVVLRAYRLLTGADRLSLVGVASRGVRSATASYGLPLGQRVRASANVSYGHTRVRYGQLADLGVTGESLSIGGDLAALLAAGDRFSLTATGGVVRSRSDTAIAGALVIRNIALNASAGASVVYAAPGLSVTAQGQATLARVDERLSDTRVAPVLFQGSAAVVTALVPRVQLRLHADWQLATRSSLPGLLQYQIGGPRSSRAFSPGAAAGDRGVATSVELGWAALVRPVVVEPFVFVDRAEAALPDVRFLATAAGGGVNIALATRLSVRASYARSIQTDNVPPEDRAFVAANLHF